ncbi:RNA polymerase sigma factor SigJ [Nonomuraea jiangxiensis]|uniref:RNA polymerase sigma-70 factor, ECF subfamily n=1 Tax=Nonomuraea jiangxiensis TaxID=633440 RepID=A0A1G9AXN0_9ACTN|nr:RNA polymerase sigma factor SigJ [Nonomuraea jiangxiensis]SDK32086.1 RNA polymerase sigma-70 factor, ECF subfamily [Nonomuraea jiangxiensis]
MVGFDRSARLDEEWELHRPAVFGAAYRLLGSVAEAEDVLQDVWLRAASADLSEVVDLRAWLVTVAARISYNVINSARVRKVGYIGPWLPEPLMTGPDVAQRVLVDDSVSTAMLLVMRELPPPERVAFVLHDVFELPFEQIAGALGRSPVACRKLASRARRRVAGARVPPRASRAERERVLYAFRAASQAGDLAGLVSLLDPDVVYVADGGGKATAARVPVHGVERVARLLLWFGTHRPGDRVEVVEVNGDPGLATHREGRLCWIDTVEVRDGRIAAYLRVANPDKLPGHL